jgi:hypothetical protein
MVYPGVSIKRSLGDTGGNRDQRGPKKKGSSSQGCKNNVPLLQRIATRSRKVRKRKEAVARAVKTTSPYCKG